MTDLDTQKDIVDKKMMENTHKIIGTAYNNDCIYHINRLRELIDERAVLVKHLYNIKEEMKDE